MSGFYGLPGSVPTTLTVGGAGGFSAGTVDGANFIDWDGSKFRFVTAAGAWAPIASFSLTVNGAHTISDAGIANLSEYQVAATKVVGAQGAAVADATDAASVITQLNALLARLRTHGLIAT